MHTIILHQSAKRFMRAAICFAIGLCGTSVQADLSAPGPYAAGRTDVTVSRTDGSTFTATVHYPAETPGVGAPLDDAGAPYPGISFGHGFLQAVTQYQSTLEHLATHGYVVIAPRSAGGLLPDHSAFAEDLSCALTWLEANNADTQSPFHNAIDTGAFGMSGHSMGGGASILAAANDARVAALANMAAAETNPSAVAAIVGVAAPVRLIAGDMDSITPVNGHTGPMYDAAAAPKQLCVIAGGFHCGFVDNWFVFCDSGSISRAEQLAIVRRLLTAFFNLHLKGEQSLWPGVWGPAASADSGVAMTSDAGVRIAAQPPELAGLGGAMVRATLEVCNERAAPASYRMFVEDASWPIALDPAVTPVIEPGASAMVVLEAAVPACAGDDALTLLISARDEGDMATRGWLELPAVRAGRLGDFTGDGVVGLGDLNVLLAHWGPCPAQDAAACPWDIAPPGGDGAVGLGDLNIVLSQWGACP
jgi:dienelactone hydrolase